MADAFNRKAIDLDSPVRDWAIISPSNSADLSQRPRALYLPVGGNVACVGDTGTAVIFPLSAGWHPISPVRVRATGTDPGLVIFGGW